MESEKDDINELISKTETDSYTQETNLWVPKQGRDKIKNMAFTYTHYYI